MLNEQQIIRISKFLSLILRHQPQKIGITLDENGWTDVPTLIEKCNKAGIRLDMETLLYVVENNSKKRYALNETQDKIRANQGHSVKVDLAYTPKEPPTILFHGTAKKNVESILDKGITKQNRHHVHLSSHKDTALQVGQRHGQPHIFEVQAKKMYNDGFLFFESENGVWLTDVVPAKYIGIVK